MRYTDFLQTKRIGTSILNFEYFADVEVTTGFLWWKKTTRRQVHKAWGPRTWRFTDTGRAANGLEELADAWYARKTYDLGVPFAEHTA